MLLAKITQHLNQCCWHMKNWHSRSRRGLPCRRCIDRGRTKPISILQADKGGSQKHTRTIPMQIQKIFTTVKAIFRGEENQSPLFIHSQNIPGNPKENQLAKRDTYKEDSVSLLNILVEESGHTIRLKRLLNTGIAEAIIQATTQTPNAMATQDPTATISFLCMRSVPAKRRT